MLLHILQDFGKAHDFLVAIVMQEVDKTGEKATMSRFLTKHFLNWL